MSWIAGSTLILGAVIVVGFVWYERTHPTTRVIALVATLAAMAALGRVAFARAAERQADDRHRADRRLRARRRARVHGRRGRRAGQQPVLRAGPVDAVADGRLGRRRAVRRGRSRASPAATSAASRWRPPARVAGLGFGAVMNLSTLGDLLRRSHDGQAGRRLRHLAAVRHRPRHRQRRSSASPSARAGPRPAALPDALRHHLAAERAQRGPDRLRLGAVAPRPPARRARRRPASRPSGGSPSTAATGSGRGSGCGSESMPREPGRASRSRTRPPARRRRRRGARGQRALHRSTMPPLDVVAHERVEPELAPEVVIERPGRRLRGGGQLARRARPRSRRARTPPAPRARAGPWRSRSTESIRHNCVTVMA